MKKYSNNIIATLCYVVRDNKVLMVHRVKKKNDIHKGKYNGLGGKLEKNETPYDCVIREVFEESGLKIKNPVLRGILTFPDFDGKNNWIVFVYIADKFSGRIIKSNEGVLKWVDIKNVLKLNLWEGDRYFLRYLFNTDDFFYGNFTYRKDKLISYSIRSIK